MEHDKLVPLSHNQTSPEDAQPGDFPAKSVLNKFTGTSGKQGEAEGQNKLAGQSVLQVGPRHNEDSGVGSGAGTPSNWLGGRKSTVASGFPILKGDTIVSGTSVSIPEEIDLKTGQIICKGYKGTPLKETEDPNVEYGA